LVIDLTYIANQPDDNSEGVDIIGQHDYGLINWNCVLLVPTEAKIATATCVASVKLPAGWSWGAALQESTRNGDLVSFAPTTIATLVDCPLLIGSRLERVRLHAQGADGPEVTLHIAAPARSAQLRDEHFITGLRRMTNESFVMFGGAWFPHYDVLMILNGSMMGLEHSACSVNGFGAWLGATALHAPWQLELLPHEYIHSWIGKYRRPQGMLVDDFTTTPVQDLLWVYEGLTEYLGRVLAVRSGIMTANTWRTDLASTIAELAAQPGRRWRTIRDTCVSTHLLRASSRHHGGLRRGQDYYYEGALFWLAADLHMRTQSSGKRSLDDFCRAFFGPQGVRKPGYNQADVIAALNEICPADWSGMITRWIDTTGDLDTNWVTGSGWKLRMVSGAAAIEHIVPTQVTQEDIHNAIGLTLHDGWVSSVLAGSLADAAGIENEDFVHSVNGTPLSNDKSALARAVLHSPHQPILQLYVCRNRTDWSFKNITYQAGVTRSKLERVEDAPDLLQAILTPQVVVQPALSPSAP
ncbi:MAG: hypothetical protein AAB263_06140, partial [Planctomycetota bacterium]